MVIARTDLLPIAGAQVLGGQATSAAAPWVTPARAVALPSAGAARRATLEVLLDRYGAPLFDYVFRLTGGAPESARLTADVLAEGAIHPACPSPVTGADRFAYAESRETAVRLFADATARCLAMRPRRRAAFTLKVPRWGGRGAAAVPVDDPATAQHVLDTLQPSQRACILLREHHQLTYDEIAVVLKTSRAAVAALLLAGREALRRELRPA